MRFVNVVGVKGGVGCSSVVALCAAALVEAGRRVAVIDRTGTGDVRSILGADRGSCGVGFFDDLDQLVAAMHDELWEGAVVLVDHPALPVPLPDVPGVVVMVTATCGLALRRTVSVRSQPDGVVVMVDRGRSFGVDDAVMVAWSVSAAPHRVVEVELDRVVAARIDAGLLQSVPARRLHGAQLVEFITMCSVHIRRRGMPAASA